MVKKLLVFFSIIFAFSACFREAPMMYDGTMNITLYMVFQDSNLGYDLALSNMKVVIKTGNYDNSAFIATTDSAGKAVFNNIPWANYDVDIMEKVKLPYLDSAGVAVPDSFIYLGLVDTSVVYSPDSLGNVIDTVYAIAGAPSEGLKINEIYYTGPINRSNWFYDQYVELYNSSDEVKYLDGMIICRVYHMLDRVTYAFQFPGTPLTGNEYPVQPGEFVVVATDAYDHRLTIPKSINLSKADWEFVNSADVNDYDNPNVPNINNIIPGKNTDFLINLVSNVIVLADGSDANVMDQLDINTVVDCVEYSSSSDHIKDIDKVLDRGWAGTGNQRYSGQSVERILPGFDTNNSFNDFIIINPPTPGWQH
ncbi:MAG: DUF4876 domain-containing protein [Candidatus Marinimicrobia bacterium]|nr:DUF4876 domain-containing protein [Candidatus Neomarinimicrobiota bacterium]